MESCLLIINPSSGKANGAELLPKILSALSTRYLDIEVRYTKKKGDAECFTKQAIHDSHQSIYCVGGDGTIKEVVNGIVKNKSDIHLGIIPNGTVNDVARSLKIPLPAEKAIENIPNTSIKKIDVGQVNDDYFVSLIAIGGIPEAIQNVSVSAKTRWGALSYLVNGARYAFRQKPFRVRVTINNKCKVIETSLIVLSLHNSVASMKNFFYTAKADDGFLHMMIFPKFRLIGAAVFVWKIIIGSISNDKAISIEKTKHVEIETESASLPINVDGDKENHFPLQIRILPAVLSVFVPFKK